MKRLHAEELNKIYRNVLADIKNQQCVLLVGPEVVTVRGESLSTHLRNHLLRTNNDDITHYYQKDGFFLFKDSIAKEDVQRELKLYFESIKANGEVEESIYRQISEIPFHLVVSINPDTFLSDYCIMNGIKHRFGFFRINGGAIPDMDEPTKQLPLFYNLCGCVQDDESLVLDYDDLFRLMKSVLGSPGLPPKLKATLESAKTFICLGFDFEKWYSQLLLRLLSEKKGSSIKKYAINTDIADTDTSTFLVHQFGITFLGEDRAFFHELHERCKSEIGLRELFTTGSTNKHRILDLVQKGEIKSAFNQINSCLSTNDVFRNDFIILSSQYNDLESKRLAGMLDMRDYFVRFNQIIDGIIELVKHID